MFFGKRTQIIDINNQQYFLKIVPCIYAAFNEITNNLKIKIGSKPKLIDWRFCSDRSYLLFENLEGFVIPTINLEKLIIDCASITSKLHNLTLISDERFKIFKRSLVLYWINNQKNVVTIDRNKALESIMDDCFEFYFYLNNDCFSSNLSIIHGDLAGNMFLTNDEMFLIDFENSFQFDPLFEISSLFVRHDLYHEKEFFMNYYHNSEPNSDFSIYNPLNVLIDTLWSYKTFTEIHDNESSRIWNNRLENLFYNINHLGDFDFKWKVI